MTASAASLVETIRRCRLLEQRHVEVLAGDLLPRFPESRLLARELIRRDWLTPFQMNQLARGHGEQLCFGAYVLLERLGKGGMGRVYKARRLDDGKVIALKILRKRFVSYPLAQERFRREAQTVAELSHPNIVQALEAGHVGTMPYLAMEYVKGIDLGRMVEKRGPLPITEACIYAYQAALGLQHAHENGVIHRDIKPRNLLIVESSSAEQVGSLKILDFGLALLESEAIQEERLTQLGRRVGTVQYMAPEQEADCREADPCSDVYSLGCSLFFALAGRPPLLEAAPVAARYPGAAWEAPPVHRFRPDVLPALSAVLARMLARKPAERYQTAGATADALNAFCPKLRIAMQPIPEVAAEPGTLEETIRRESLALAPIPAAASMVIPAHLIFKKRVIVLSCVAGLFLLLVLLLVLQPFASRVPIDTSHERPVNKGKVVPVTPPDKDSTRIKKKEEIEDPDPEEMPAKKKREEVEDP